MTHDLTATAISILHGIIFILNVVVPFLNDEHLLQLYVICVPFMWLHWMTNNDTCALTLMESKLRGISSNDTYLHRIISPVYKFQSKEAQHRAWWLISYVLWVIAVIKFFGYKR